MMTLTPIQNGTTGRTRELKLAILESFTMARGGLLRRMEAFEPAEWQKVLSWLDISGMALYFLDQMWCLGAEHVLPPSFEAQLQERLRQNRLRARSMISQSLLLAKWLQDARIPYAFLKGVTLAPQSVPDAALRWQADLDILLPEKHSALATHHVLRLGYRLHARSGNTLEFRTTIAPPSDLSQMYSHASPSGLELHLSSESGRASQMLDHRILRDIPGGALHSLCPADVLVQQALHLLKHLSGEHTRVSWVLEFRRHVEARRGDAAFWSEVERLAAAEPNGDLAMAVGFWLCGILFGNVGMELPQPWWAESLPDRVRVWLGLYGVDVLLSDGFGSKLYALLKQELPQGAADKRTVRQVLVPSRVPLRLSAAALRQNSGAPWRHVWNELRYFTHRCSFHLVEGIRFAIQSARWRRAVARCSR